MNERDERPLKSQESIPDFGWDIGLNAIAGRIDRRCSPALRSGFAFLWNRGVLCKNRRKPFSKRP